MDRRDTRLLHVGLFPSKEGKIDVDFDKNSGIIGGGGGGGGCMWVHMHPVCTPVHPFNYHMKKCEDILLKLANTF